MLKRRREARDLARSLKTVDELERLIESINVTDDEREIARMVFEKGWTRQKIANETGYSRRQVDRKIAKIHDRIC